MFVITFYSRFVSTGAVHADAPVKFIEVEYESFAHGGALMSEVEYWVSRCEHYRRIGIVAAVVALVSFVMMFVLVLTIGWFDLALGVWGMLVSALTLLAASVVDRWADREYDAAAEFAALSAHDCMPQLVGGVR